MEEHTKEFKDYVAGFLRQWKLILGIAATGSLATLAVAGLLPATYKSSATILIEQQEMPADLVRSTISSFADQRIQVIRSQVMTRGNLLRIVETYDLYPNYRGTATTEEVISRLTQNIKLDLLRADSIDSRAGNKATIAFTLSYTGENPRVTQQVTNELATLFLSQNIRTREQKAAETASFLGEEAAKLSAKVSETESKLARFKERFAGRLPELMQLNMQLRDRTETELKEVERQIGAQEERLFFLENQLAQTKPTLPTPPVVTATGERVVDPEERLNQLKGQLASLSSVYSSDHPDVMKARRLIESLEKQVAAGAAAGAAKPKPPVSTPGPAAAPPDNPAYITLVTQIEGIRTELKSLRAQRPMLQGKLASFESRLQQTPSVEREYLELTRDHEQSLARYREIRSKQMTADIGQELERDRKAERFSLIDPAQVPEKPSSPNRQGILLVGLMLSFGGGFGAAAFREALDTSIRGSKALAAALDVSVLAVIPLVEDRRKIRRKRLLLWGGILATVALLAIGVLAVHLLYMPLDILWFRLVRILQRYFPALAGATDALGMERAWNG